MAAGGLIHLREWLDPYRNVPPAAPGAFVVRGRVPGERGAVSLVLAGALLTTGWRLRRYLTVVVLTAIAFEAASLAAPHHVAHRKRLRLDGAPVDDGANQARALEIGAVLFARGGTCGIRPNQLVHTDAQGGTPGASKPSKVTEPDTATETAPEALSPARGAGLEPLGSDVLVEGTIRSRTLTDIVITTPTFLPAGAALC